MKDIDPEVAALIGKNPATLPKALVDEGWGQYSMQRAEQVGLGRRVKPSTEQQPTYTETCVGCARPITHKRRSEAWVDHSGKNYCPADVVDLGVNHHFPESDRSVIEHYVKARQKEAEQIAASLKTPPTPRVRLPPDPGGPCGANKHHAHCEHQCSQKSGHFGFHECIKCRHLWR